LIQNSELEKLYKNLQHPPSLSGTDLLKIALSSEYDNAKAFLNDDVIEAIRDLLNADKADIPDSLNASLRPYQVTGYEWLYKNSKLGFGSLMADDMGLGKTIQVITTLLKFKQEGFFVKKQSLVVVPTTLLTNWVNEIERFAPELSVSVYHGTKREIPKEKVDIILTTYGTVRNDIEKLKKLNLHTLIIDEAQNIKNPDTEQTKVVKQLKAEIKIAMSGTPVENRLSEYWSIFDFVNKGYLGSLKKFNDEYVIPIKQYNDAHKLEKFKKITQPFIMRRLKSDKSIIQDLPDKIENNQYCSLSKEQASLYQKTVDNTMKEVMDSEGIARRGLVLKLMTSLKQICNHPNHYLKKSNPDPNISGKMMLLNNIIENILESNEKTLIFTQYKEMGDLLVESIQNQFKIDTLFLYGGISRSKRDEMVKIFQESRGHKIFILSLKAGGTGLNLTAASNVVHYDLWWNPAVEAQATDRAYRIGQKSNVMVYRLLTKGTLEEKIDLMLNSKKELANLAVSSGEQWIGDLSDNELKDLVKLSQ
jgi:SNF2 family DNA or RNA helicase